MKPLPITAALAAFGVALGGSDAAAQDVEGRFDVGDRSVRRVCIGEGAPTVVIDAGMGTDG
jgi:hypothetical protein